MAERETAKKGQQMAMVHFETKPISRSSGRSSTASSAYRAGVKLEDNRTGLIHDFTKKQENVIANECFIFKDGKRIQINRGELWNTVEKTEKRKDARTAREFILNLPHELTHDQRKKLTDDFGNYLSEKFSVAIDYAIHEPNPKGDQRNYHAHVMVTTRTAKLDQNNKIILGDKTSLELSNKKLKKLELPSTFEQIKSLRKAWTDCTNHHLHQAGIDITLDHRSFKEQGKEQLPTIKLGWYQSMLERVGIATKGGDYNRQVKEHNAQLEQTQAELDRLQLSQAEKNKQREQERKLERERKDREWKEYLERVEAESAELEQRKKFEQRERKPMFDKVGKVVEKLIHRYGSVKDNYASYQGDNRLVFGELAKIYSEHLPKCRNQSDGKGYDIGFGDDIKLMDDGRVGVKNIFSNTAYSFYCASDVLEVRNKKRDSLNQLSADFVLKGSDVKFSTRFVAYVERVVAIVEDTRFEKYAPRTNNTPTPTYTKTNDRNNDLEIGLGF